MFISAAETEFDEARTTMLHSPEIVARSGVGQDL
jgi:hypothetical protein